MGVRTGSTPPGSRDGGGGAGSDGGGGGAVAEELHGLSLEQRRTVLQVKLQQRRSWENLEQQRLVPPLRMASAIRNLDRARTEDFLKHKIWNRPDRKELVKKHILEDTQAQPALQAAQLRLKRARLAADLNGRLALRPGPIELVQRHILAVDSAGLQLGAGGAHVDEEEDDARSLSPDSLAPPPQGPSPPPQGPSLDFSVPGPDPSSPADPGAQQQQQQQQRGRQGDAASAMGVLANPLHARQGQPAGVTPPSKPRSPLVKHTQPQPEAGGQRARSRGKDPRPKVRKLKYHQYVPPGQRPAPDKGGGAAAAASAPGTATAARSPGGGRPEAPCDGRARGPPILPAGTTPYTRLLQQQQMFLDLQTLGQPHQQRQPEAQLHHQQQQRQLLGQQRLLPLQAGPHAPSSLPPSSPTRGAIKSEPRTSGPDASPGASSSGSPAHRPGGLPSNLDEMKVTELRHELKRRSLPVSGTKPALLERLRRAFSAVGGSAPPAAAPPPPDGDPEPGCDSGDSSLSPGPCGTPGVLAPSPGVKEERTGTPGSEADAAAGDRLLLEMKRRKIQELQRLLEQEQKQADELRRQIAREKSLRHGGQASPPPPQQQHSPSFPQAGVSPGYPGDPASPGFLPSRGPVVARPGPPRPCGRGGPGGREDALAFRFPRADPRRRSPPSPTAAPVKRESLAGDGAVPSAPGPCGAEAEADREPPPRTPPMPAGVEVKRERAAPEREELAAFPDSPSHHGPGPGDALQLETPDLPPSYEDAVKHKAPSMQGGLEQHMDDLLDILIENGEIPASAREQKEPRSSPPGASPAPARPTGGVGGGHLGLAATFRLSLSTAAPSPSSSPPSEAQLAASLGVVIGVCGGGGGGGDAVWADEDAFWAEAEAGAGSEGGASDRERDEDGVDWAELASGLAPLAHAPPAGPFSSADLFDAGGGGKDLVFGAASQLF